MRLAFREVAVDQTRNIVERVVGFAVGKCGQSGPGSNHFLCDKNGFERQPQSLKSRATIP
jgi:hypothetical protein